MNPLRLPGASKLKIPGADLMKQQGVSQDTARTREPTGFPRVMRSREAKVERLTQEEIKALAG